MKNNYDVKHYFRQLVVQIIIFLALIFVIIGCIVIVFTKKITQPIQVLTEYTTDLKKAEDKKSKEKMIEKILLDPLFRNIAL